MTFVMAGGFVSSFPAHHGALLPADGSCAEGDLMAETPSHDEIPLGQRLYDRPFLLLGFGLIVMFTFYTGWGLYEILSLPKATLP
jgi:hypothetical protein